MTVLVETTKVSPALAQFTNPTTPLPPSLFVAWTGTNAAQNLNVLGSFSGGVWNDSNKAVLPETDLQGPALASGNGSPLYVAWTGTDKEHHLNIAFSNDGRKFEGKVTLGETSLHSPALAYSGEALYVAWTGTDKRVNIAALGVGGANFGKVLKKVTLNETSDIGPALAAVGQNLYVAWSGTDAQHRLNVIESINGGATWGGKATLNETTALQPALTVLGNAAHGLVYLAWTGTDAGHHLNYLTAPLGSTAFGGKHTIGQTSVAGPALAEFQGKIYVSWAGTDSENHLNVALI